MYERFAIAAVGGQGLCQGRDRDGPIFQGALRQEGNVYRYGRRDKDGRIFRGALRQEGNVELSYAGKQQHMALLSEGERASARTINIALLSEGERASARYYKHGPPVGGRTCLGSNYKHCPPVGGRTCLGSVL